MNKIKEFISSYLDYLRDLPYRHSEENLEFTKNKLIAHRFYMEGFRKTSPYLHPDYWQDDNEVQLSNQNK